MNRIAILSDTTNAENQDRVKVEYLSDDETVITVADGAGGSGDGGRSAEAAIRLTEKYASKISAQEFSEPNTWVKLLYEIDRRIYSDSQAGETTCVITAVRKGIIIGASVGDSGLWCIDNSGITDLTEKQYRKPLLGSGAAIPVSFGPLRCGGSLLAATDGLLKYIKADELKKIIKTEDTEQAVKQMIESVRLPSGNLWDDTSMVLYRSLCE